MSKSIEFEIKIKGDSKPLRSLTVEAANADDAIKEVVKSASEAGESLRRIAEGSLVLDTATRAVNNLSGIVNGLTAPFNSFETAMLKANTMAQTSGRDFDGLTESIVGLSKNIPLAREALAEGLYQTVSNGVPKDNWITFLEQSSKAAVGGVADLGQTVTVTSTIIKNYGLAWDAAGEIQDKIQTTAKNGVTSFEQLGQALPRVSGSAASLGVEINELMAVFATATGVTGNTSEVSTQLAAVLNSLIKPSSEASAAAEAMGIRFDAASVKACGGFRNFLAELDSNVQAYAESSGQLSETIYGQLFGSAEALRLIGSLTGEQKDKFVENIDAMCGSAGAIDEAFSMMSSSGEAAETTFRNNIQSMADWAGALASASAPYVQFVADSSTLLLSMGQMNNLFKSLAVGIGTWTKNVHLSALAQKMAAIATEAWEAVQIGLNAVMSANPVALVILAVAALVAIVKTAYENCEAFRNICDKTWEVIKEFAAIIWEHLVKAFERASKVIKTAWEWVKKFFGISDKSSAEKASKAIDAQSESAEKLAESNAKAAESGLKIKESADWQKMSYEELGKAIDKQKSKVAALAGVNAARAKSESEQLKAMEARHKSLGQQYGLSSGSEAANPKGLKDSLKKEIKTVRGKIDIEVDVNKKEELYAELVSLEKRLKKIEAGEYLIRFRVENPDFRKIDSGQMSDIKKPALTDSFSYKKSGTQELNNELRAMDSSISRVVGKATASAEKIKTDIVSAAVTGMSSISGMMTTISQLTDESSAAWLQWGANILDACSKALPAIMAVTAGKAAESAAATPVVGWLMAGTAIAGVLAAFASIPKFADGGIAYGPTLGIFGEYAGAANNPEVVAPLSKLKSMLQPAGQPVIVGGTLRARGRDIVCVLANETRIAGKSGKRTDIKI